MNKDIPEQEHFTGVKPTPSRPGEIVYGDPGAEMKMRQRAESKANGETKLSTAETKPISKEVSAVQPHKVNLYPKDIVQDLCDNGIVYYKFFVSSTLPQGTQWFFPTPRLLMINTLDFIEMQDRLAVEISKLTGFKGDGFVGNPASLYEDPTFGPMMAMAGMFNVEQKKVDG